MTHETRDAVFMVGCHRSGTTLLRYLLDAHPVLACPPESKFISGLHAFLEYPQAISGMHSLGLTQSHIFGLLRQMVQDVFAFYAKTQSKPRWIDKTPNYARILPFIDNLFNQNALYLIVVRHPFDCILSLQTKFHETRYGDPDLDFSVKHYGNDLCGWAKYWREMNERLHVWRKANWERCYVIRYEDLVSNPEKRLAEVLDFLAVDRVPGDTSQMCREAFAGNHAHGYGDGKIRSTHTVHDHSVRKWKNWTPEQIQAYWTIVGRVAEEFGYNATEAAAQQESSNLRIV
jgi:hypothetical protein